MEKNINLECKNKALSDIVRTLQKLKEIEAADSNRVRTVYYMSALVPGDSENNKCSETYLGTSAFSEIECQNIRDYTLTMDPVPVLATCLHSYSQLYLWPYSYWYNAYAENYVEISNLANEAVKALKAVHGTVFDPVNSAYWGM